MVIIDGWDEFIEQAQQQIFPIYLQHEQSFDSWGIHGRMHVCRALIFAETMARLYIEHAQDVDMFAVRTAVAFHDSGRQANGPDYWESESAGRCSEYLKATKDADYANYVASLITKTDGNWDINKRIMHDADVLEIMRPCCGHGGIDGFRPQRFRFAGENDPLAHFFSDGLSLRSWLINEAWKLIQATEEIKPSLTFTIQYYESLQAKVIAKFPTDQFLGLTYFP